MNVAVFDLCGTLYGCNTLFAFTKWACPTSKKRAFADSFIMKLWDRIDPKLNRRRNMHLSLLKDFNKDELGYLSRTFFQNILPRYEREYMHNLLYSLQRAGWYTLLVSSAPDFLVEEAARRLGFYDYMASDYRNGRLTVDITGKKLNSISEYLPAELLLVVSDNFSDLTLLKRADARIIITEKRHQKKWEKYFDRDELYIV